MWSRLFKHSLDNMLAKGEVCFSMTALLVVGAYLCIVTSKFLQLLI